MPDSHITVASYNVHRCIGTDGRLDLHRVAAVIKSLDADVIGIQEVNSSNLGDRETDQLEYLSKMSGLDFIMGPTIHEGRSQYGNAILTNLKLVAVRRIDLSVRDREPRGALDVDLQVDGRTVRIIVTHLGLSAVERKQQFRKLRSLLDTDGSEVQIVMGDFNDWYPFSRPIAWLNRHFGRSPAKLTFPSTFPLLPLDRIWVKPSETMLRMKVHATPLSRMASDHLPIIATLALTDR